MRNRTSALKRALELSANRAKFPDPEILQQKYLALCLETIVAQYRVLLAQLYDYRYCESDVINSAATWRQKTLQEMPEFTEILANGNDDLKERLPILLKSLATKQNTKIEDPVHLIRPTVEQLRRQTAAIRKELDALKLREPLVSTLKFTSAA